MLQLTSNAVNKLKELRRKEGKAETCALRLGVKAGGCSGLSYTMDFVTEAAERDKTYQFEGLTVYVDPKSALYLHGMELDYVESLKEVGFRFQNPNVTRSCACGESFAV